MPKNRKPGKVIRPFKIFNLELPEDPAKHFVLQSMEIVEESDFVRRMADDLKAAGTSAGLLFIHGYNTSFDGGLYRSAQLAVDLEFEGLMLHYSWPSRGDFRDYDYDDNSVKQAREHFLEFLRVLDQTPIRRLSVIAHSKGNDLLLETLQHLPKSRLSRWQQVVLASADVDSDFARQAIPKIGKKVKGVTLYARKEDLALEVSRVKAGGVPRAGDIQVNGWPIIVQGADSIDASNSKLHLMEFNHNAFVADTVLRYDLARLVATGRRPPHERSPSITRQVCDEGEYWRLEPY